MPQSQLTPSQLGIWSPMDFIKNCPAPTLSSLAPPNGTHATAIPLQVNDGQSFVQGATVFFNGTPLATTFVSAGQLTCTIPAAQTPNPGSYPVQVQNPGALVSEPLIFTAT